MKILIISSFLPYPLFSGGHVRLYNLMKELSKRHTLTLVCEKRDSQGDVAIAQVGKVCSKVVTVDRKKQWTIGNIVQSGISSYPFLMVGHTNSELKRRIQEAFLKEQFDLIHIETFYVMQNLPSIHLPTVLVDHNIEYLVYRRYVDQASFFLRPLLAIDVRKMEYWEKEFWKRASVLVAVSEHDKTMMGRDDVFVVPNGVDLNKFKVQSFDKAQDKSAIHSTSSGQEFKVQEREKRILFIGDFKWVQNRDAVEWILKEIWPVINSKFIHSTSSGQNSKFSLKLWIVGKEIPEELKRLGSENVLFDENAPDDTPSIYKEASILLAPIRIGGGSKFKILEAMASGVPVVTTSVGIEGLEITGNKDVLVGDNPDEISHHVIHLLQNEGLYQMLSENARGQIEKQYDWKIVAKKLEDVYRSVVT